MALKTEFSALKSYLTLTNANNGTGSQTRHQHVRLGLPDIHHRLRRSASTVLTATAKSMADGEF